MKLTAVQSSQINAIGFAAATKTMRIEFKSGSLYEYANITPDLFEAFSKAPSVGSFFYKNIKPFADKYPYVKLEDNKAMEAPAPEPTTDAVAHPTKPGSPPNPVPLPPQAAPEPNADNNGDPLVANDTPPEEHEQPGGGGL